MLPRWYEDNEPESIAIPDYDNRILEAVRQLSKIALNYIPRGREGVASLSRMTIRHAFLARRNTSRRGWKRVKVKTTLLICS